MTSVPYQKDRTQTGKRKEVHIRYLGHRGVNIWNSLSSNIRESLSLNGFKVEVKSVLRIGSAHNKRGP